MFILKKDNEKSSPSRICTNKDHRLIDGKKELKAQKDLLTKINTMISPTLLAKAKKCKILSEISENKYKS